MWITVEQADAHYADNSAWAEVTNKAEVITEASIRLDGLIFYGEDFHRTTAKYTEGVVTDSETPIPLRLKMAVAELALHYFLYPASVIDPEDVSSLVVDGAELADLPLSVQNYVTPFLYSSDVNAPEVLKEDRQERKKMKSLAYNGSSSTTSNTASTALDTAAVRALLVELGYVDQDALDAAIAAIPGIEAGGLNETQIRALIDTLGYRTQAEINTAIANAIDAIPASNLWTR